jgi:hypothetical protein
LLQRYFDAHVYFANWGTRRLVLRIPAKSISAKSLRPHFVGDSAKLRSTAKYITMELVNDDEEGSDYYEHEDDESPLTTLSPLRAELLRGDLRLGGHPRSTARHRPKYRDNSPSAAGMASTAPSTLWPTAPPGRWGRCP